MTDSFFFFFFFALLESADDKGFTCQQCGLVRREEEIKKIASEVNILSKKTLALTSCGSILFFFFPPFCSCNIFA